MTSRVFTASALCITFLPGGLSRGFADDVYCSPVSPIANGSMSVCWKQPEVTKPTSLLIHFHGAPNTVKMAFARSDLNVVLVVVNFPGLSRAYSTPFEMDHNLFQQILDHATIKSSSARTVSRAGIRRTIRKSTLAAPAHHRSALESNGGSETVTVAWTAAIKCNFLRL